MPETVPEAAVMVAGPWATPAASPFEPEESETVATPASEVDQVSSAVTSRVVASLKVPVAASCSVRPTPT